MFFICISRSQSCLLACQLSQMPESWFFIDYKELITFSHMPRSKFCEIQKKIFFLVHLKLKRADCTFFLQTPYFGSRGSPSICEKIVFELQLLGVLSKLCGYFGLFLQVLNCKHISVIVLYCLLFGVVQVVEHPAAAGHLHMYPRTYTTSPFLPPTPSHHLSSQTANGQCIKSIR